MLWFYGHYKYFDPYSAGIDFRRHESDVYRRQILTPKVDARAVRVISVLLAHQITGIGIEMRV